jgi:hypothetical protein
VNLTLRHLTNFSPISSWLITSNFSSTPIVFHRLFTWIALGDADLRFLLILVMEANAFEGGITSAT